MNSLYIIGNLTADPVHRTTPGGVSVCSFTVAVNRRHRKEGEPEADFFRVTAWRQLADICSRYLAKGRKVSVAGPVGMSTYKGQDGETRAQLEVTAQDIEFLTTSEKAAVQAQEAPKTDRQTGFAKVDEELPF